MTLTKKLYDGEKILGDLSGLGKTEIHNIWEEVKANAKLVRDCPLHKFLPVTKEELRGTINKKFHCLKCGGGMNLSYVGAYIRGYAAAGGNTDVIWPGWNKST